MQNDWLLVEFYPLDDDGGGGVVDEMHAVMVGASAVATATNKRQKSRILIELNS